MSKSYREYKARIDALNAPLFTPEEIACGRRMDLNLAVLKQTEESIQKMPAGAKPDDVEFMKQVQLKAQMDLEEDLEWPEPTNTSLCIVM